MKKILILTFVILMLTTSFAYAEMSIMYGQMLGMQNTTANGVAQGTKSSMFGFCYGGGGRYGHESYVFYGKKNGINYINTGGGLLVNIAETGSDRVKAVPYFTFGMGTTMSFGTFNANNVTSATSAFDAQATICVAFGVKTYFSEKLGVRVDARMFKPFSITNSLTDQLNNLTGASTSDKADKTNWLISFGATFRM